MKNSDIVIVGGGAVGCATAYFLAKAGAKVTVLEKEKVAYGASGYAMGLLSPLYGLGIPGPLEGLSLEGFLMHRQLAPELLETTGIDYHAHSKDSIYLAFSDGEAEGLKGIEAYSERVDGVSCRWLDGPAVMAVEPRVSQAVYRGMLVKGTWLLDADLYTQALAQGARAYGAEFRDDAAVGLKRLAKGATVQTGGGDIKADAVVLAMGPWTGEVEGWLGVPVPVSPLKGQILRMVVEGPPMECSIHYNSNYVGPKADGLVWVGTTEERVGFDNAPTEEARVSHIEGGRNLLSTGNFGQSGTSDGLPTARRPRRSAGNWPSARLGRGVPLNWGGSQGDYPQPVHGQVDGGHGAGPRRRA